MALALAGALIYLQRSKRYGKMGEVVLYGMDSFRQQFSGDLSTIVFGLSLSGLFPRQTTGAFDCVIQSLCHLLYPRSSVRDAGFTNH